LPEAEVQFLRCKGICFYLIKWRQAILRKCAGRKAKQIQTQKEAVFGMQYNEK